MPAIISFALLIGGFVVLDVAALLWGADSREGEASPEWERRRGWIGFRH